MGILGIGIFAAAVEDFTEGATEATDTEVILAISFFSIVCSTSMAVIKFNYSAHLNSPSLFKDAICSTIGATLGATLFFNTLIAEANPGLWWIDPVVSMVCGVVALVIAGQAMWVSVLVEGHPIFSCHWWYVGDEDDGATASGDVQEKPPETEIV